ncbi:MAG: L,D-transpeptidase [Acidimicrobiales bacterium]
MPTEITRSSRLARLAAGALALALLVGACSDKDSPATLDDAASTAQTTQPTSRSCDPRLDPYTNHVAYATTTGAINVYPAPGAAQPSHTFPVPRKTDTDPPVDVPMVFLVTNEPSDNCDWMEVLLPVRPNGSKGWIRRADVRLEGNNYRIVVDLNGFNLKAYEGDRVILDTEIGVARENRPTPGGVYYTTELLKPPDPNGVYGTYAFGLSGFSEVLTSFNGGQGQLGIHGTNEPNKIGQRVSNGCIRLRNEDINKLVESIQGDPYGIRVEILA